MISRHAVVDASIWIDLQAANLIDAAFHMPFAWHCPDFIVEELNSPDGRELVSQGIVEEHFSGSGDDKRKAAERTFFFSLAQVRHHSSYDIYRE